MDKRKGRNQQLIDLGMEPFQTEERERVVTKIEEVEKNFHLVMILERLDESLVLLSDILCLPLKELTSLKGGQGRKVEGGGLHSSLETLINYLAVNELTIEKEELDDHEKNVLREWLWAEYLLYDKFVEKLDKKNKEFGVERMEEKKIQLKMLNQELQKMCVIGKKEKDEDILQFTSNSRSGGRKT